MAMAIHICTICTHPMAASEPLVKLGNVTYHRSCLGKFSTKEVPGERVPVPSPKEVPGEPGRPTRKDMPGRREKVPMRTSNTTTPKHWN